MGVRDVDKERGSEEGGIAVLYSGVARFKFRMDHRLS